MSDDPELIFDDTPDLAFDPPMALADKKRQLYREAAKAELSQAPDWLYGVAGFVPGFAESVRSMGAQIGMRGQGIASRATGIGDADEAHRWAQAYEEAANELTPKALQYPARMARNLGSSLLPAAAATVATGSPYPAIALGAGSEGSEAITEARDAGLSDQQAYAHAAKQAAYEGLFALLFQRLNKVIPGLGGTESALARQAGKATVRGAITGTAGEALEEGATAFAQQAESAAAGVNPEAFTPEQLIPAVRDAAILGAAGANLANAPNVAEEVIRGRARASRLAQLKEIRAKGYVSADDGEAAGIAGETRKERLANADAEMQQLEQEIQNASAVRGPQAEVQQEQGGQDLRGSGQVEVPAQPAGEVAPEGPQVQVAQPPAAQPTDRKAMLEALAAAEAAAPAESPLTEQPRDVAAEIRAALTEGPVTVTTPKVQSGFKVVKVRDDGKVVTKKGRILTPDETWAVQTQEQASAQPEPVREALPPVTEAPAVPAAAPEAVPQAAQETPSKRSGRKIAPPPELAQAGITIKSTPQGWSVTGIPQEIADGLKIDYQGKRAGEGYFFKQDPTPGLADAARTIAAEAERDAAERAAGRVKTSIGYHTPEVAKEYEQARAERLSLAKEEISRRNDAVDELVSQFVGKGQRGKFKLKLLNAAERGDSDTLKHFDEMVQYSNDHPELGLPTDEHKLFTLLSGESFTKSDAEVADEIENELAAEIEAAIGDTSFDFGENAPKQTAIAGTEEAATSDTTGTKNVKTDELRQKAGMEERPPVEPETRDEWDSEAAKRIADNPLYAPKLAEELAEKPRALDPVEEMALNRHLRDLENRRQAGEDVSDEMATAVEASERAGTIWGRAGVSRQAERAADFSLEGIIRQHVRALNEKPSDEQLAKYAEMADKIKALEGELETEKTKRAQAEVEARIAKAKAESKKPTPAKKPPTEKRQAAEKKVADAWENFRKAALTQAGAGPHLLGPAIDVAKAYVELGYVHFSEFIASVRENIKDADAKLFRQAWMKAQPKTESDKLDSEGIGALARELTRSAVEAGIEEREAVVDTVHDDLKEMGFKISRSDAMAAISGYGEFHELSKDEVSVKIRAIKGELQQLLKLEDMQGGNAPKKTGVERRTPTDEERRLIKEVNEAKKKGGYNVTDPEKQLKSALDSAKTAARNRIADLENAIATREKIVSGQTPLKPDAELTDLRKRRDQLNEEYRKIFPPKKNGLSDARRLQMAEAMLDRHISELQAEMDAGRLGPKEKKAPLTSPALEQKRQQLKLLKEVREQARAASPEYQAQEAAKQNARYKKTLERSLALWEKRRDEAAAGKVPAKRKPTPVDREILEKKYQIEQVKRHARAEIEEAERAARGKVGKALGFGGDLLDLARAVQTGYEMSAVLRQGAFYTLGFPKQAIPAVWKSIQAAFSRRADFALHDDLMKRQNHAEYVRGGLETTAADGPLSQREELLRSRIASWLATQEGMAWALPRWASEGLLGSERAFRSFLNTMRADLFDYMKDSIEASRPGTWSEDDAKAIGHGANVFSGRGRLPYNQSGVGWSRVFYAPRWVWSRGQLLVGEPLWKGSRETRLAIGKVYVRAAMGFAAYQLIRHVIYTMLAGDDEHEPEYELDPRSSDFGKMLVGETRIDTGAGFNQLVTLAARIITGEAKRSSGKIVPIRGEDVPYGVDDVRDVIHRFLNTKLAPLPSAVMDFIVGENVVGEKATVGKIVGDRVTPMTWRDIWDAEKELNVPQGTVAALEAFFGSGVSTYGSRTKYRDASEAERKKIVAKDLKNMTRDDPPAPAYSEFLTAGQLKQFEQRHHEKRGLVIYNAAYAGKNEEALATRDKNREYLKEMGVSFEEAKQLLVDYYRRPDEKGRPGKLTKEGYLPRLGALKRLYGVQ